MQFWLRRHSEAPVEGPYSGEQLKALAAHGQVTAAAYVSADQLTWHPASTVKGLFPAPAPPAPAPPPPPPPPPVAYAPPAVPGAALPWAPAPNAPNCYGPPGETRNLIWFLVLAVIIALFGVTTTIVSVVEAPPVESFEDLFETTDDILVSDVMNCFAMLFSLGLWVCWLVWVYFVHKEVHTHLRGDHSISPGLALGLSFIPLFNLFWGVYMPYRLAETIEAKLVPQRGLTSASLVVLFQVLSIVPGCCVWGLGWIFTALAMMQIQRGLNARWADCRAAPAPVATAGW